MFKFFNRFYLVYIYVLLVLGSPDLDTVLQVCPCYWWKKGKDHLPWPVAYISSNAAQDITSSCKSTLLVHVQVSVNHNLQAHFCKVDLQMGDHQYILVCKTFAPHVQDFSLPFVEPYKVLVKERQHNLWHINHCS